MILKKLSLSAIFYWLASQLSKSKIAVRLSQSVVKIYDNDQNADMWRNGETLLLRTLMAKECGGVFIDVGANQGDWSLAVVKIGGEFNGRLIAIDPLVRNINIVEQKLVQSGFRNFSLIETAISDSRGVAQFFSAESLADSETDSLFNMKVIGYQNTNREITVSKMTLVDVVAQEHIDHIRFLKMDIEGGEYAALRGAERLLQDKAIDYIQIEFGHAARAARVFLYDIVNFMNQFPYKMFVIKPTGIAPVTFTPFTENKYSYINFLFARNDLVYELTDIILRD